MSEAKTAEYIAVLDIGSNAVRLVVFDGLNRAPVRIHNERNICSLGADISRTGRLNPEGVRRAVDSIGRFAGLIRAMKIKKVKAVATAALRDAQDGMAFIKRIKKDFGLTISLVDGEEEARLSAIGVMMNGQGDDGIIGDYGGGSLELIVVKAGRVQEKASVPLGSHRLEALKGRDKRVKEIDAQLETIPFLNDYQKQDFYALGGAWRSMARAHIRMHDHPLQVLDHYSLEGGAAIAFAKEMAQQSPASLRKTAGISQKRIGEMSVAALTMQRLFERITPQTLFFSGTGLREGLIFDDLSPAVRRQDPLLASCRKTTYKLSRFDNLKSFLTLAAWIQPLFSEDDPALKRLVEASCLLSDTGWFEQEEYQAQHAFSRVLVMPFYGADHATRAFLALAQHIRYAGREADNIARVTGRLLSNKARQQAIIVGLALRVAYLLTGGGLGLLKDTRLSLTPKYVTLSLGETAMLLKAEIIQAALQDLAAALGREAVVRALPSS